MVICASGGLGHLPSAASFGGCWGGNLPPGVAGRNSYGADRRGDRPRSPGGLLRHSVLLLLGCKRVSCGVGCRYSAGFLPFSGFVFCRGRCPQRPLSRVPTGLSADVGAAICRPPARILYGAHRRGDRPRSPVVCFATLFCFYSFASVFPAAQGAGIRLDFCLCQGFAFVGDDALSVPCRGCHPDFRRT
jgi:hypothetical protein